MISYMYLFILASKNYFFERFKFLNYDFFKKLYYIMLVLKPSIIVITLFLVSKKFNQYTSLIFIIPFFLVGFKLLEIDTKRWGHFYRYDWIQAEPKDEVRFFKLITGNFLVDVFIKDNIIFYFIFQLFYFKLSFLIVMYLIFIILYFMTMTFHLVMIQSKLGIKKVYSLFNYIFTNSITAYIVYHIIRFSIHFIKIISQKEDGISFLQQYILNSTDKLIYFLKEKHIIIFFSVFFIFVLNFIYLLYLLKKEYFQNGNQFQSATIADFISLRCFTALIDHLKINYKTLLKKEFSFIATLYEFNYKEYINTFLIDRSFFFLIAILLNIYENNYPNAWSIVFFIILVYCYLDINSGVSAKLVANMSFISDYDTLRLFNEMNIKIKELIKIKLKFFYISRLFSFLAYILITIVCSLIFHFSIITTILLLICLCGSWYFIPTMFITNNLIYMRSDYKELKKYIEDSNTLTLNQNEFFVLELYYKFMTTSLLFFIIFSILVTKIKILFLVFIIYLIIYISISILVYTIMKKILNNIYDSIERGDYSVDISKIFKKRNK